MACRSGLEVEKLLIWITEIPFKDESRRSSNFSMMGSEWYLLFSYNNGTFYNVLSLHRGTVEDGPQQVEFQAKTYVTIATELGDGEKDARYATIQQAETTDLWHSGYSRENIFKTLPDLYSNCKMKFVCKFYGLPQSAFQIETGPSTTLRTTSPEEPSDLECLSRDLGRLLEDEQQPDVRLNCGDLTFPAHRSVLSARSEVFAAMFRNRMAERETGVVDVKDFDPDAIGHFLQYLYTGRLTAESGDAVASLCAMADKYDVDSLKRACARWIVGNLTEENCVQFLTAAKLHGGEVLKKKAVAFICGHSAVMLGEEWAVLKKSYPELAFEVYESFVRCKTEE